LQVIKEEKEKQTILQKLAVNQENQGDVTFSVGDPSRGQQEVIKAHSFILSSLSPVFEKMFDLNWRGQGKPINLPDVNPKIFRDFLQVSKSNSKSNPNYNQTILFL
jgi:hypothetical protein